MARPTATAVGKSLTHRAIACATLVRYQDARAAVLTNQYKSRRDAWRSCATISAETPALRAANAMSK